MALLSLHPGGKLTSRSAAFSGSFHLKPDHTAPSLVLGGATSPSVLPAAAKHSNRACPSTASLWPCHGVWGPLSLYFPIPSFPLPLSCVPGPDLSQQGSCWPLRRLGATFSARTVHVCRADHPRSQRQRAEGLLTHTAGPAQSQHRGSLTFPRISQRPEPVACRHSQVQVPSWQPDSTQQEVIE